MASIGCREREAYRCWRVSKIHGPGKERYVMESMQLTFASRLYLVGTKKKDQYRTRDVSWDLKTSWFCNSYGLKKEKR